MANRGDRATRAHPALLEDLSTVLAAHGFPPLRGYALAELAGSLYRISRLHG